MGEHESKQLERELGAEEDDSPSLESTSSRGANAR